MFEFILHVYFYCITSGSMVYIVLRCLPVYGMYTDVDRQDDIFSISLQITCKRVY